MLQIPQASIVFSPLEGGLRERNNMIVKANNILKGKHFTDLTPSAPMGVRKLITAQMNDYADNNENVRSRTLFQATPIGIGWAFTMTARVIRVAVRTLGVVISAPVAAFQQSRYGQMKDEGEKILKYNIVAEDLRRIGYEWVDLAISLFVVPFIGVINTLAPRAIPTRFLYDYYATRIEQATVRNMQFDRAKDAFSAQAEAKHRAWKTAVENQ